MVPPMLKITASYPFEILAVDLVSLPPTKKGNVAILVAVDHYSKFMNVVPLKNKKSVSVINALNCNIVPFLPRRPTKILSDNGPEWSSQLFEDWIDSWGMKLVKTTPYKPTSNGMVERTNQTVTKLLANLENKEGHWDDHLPRAACVYNSTYHSELKMSPSEFLLCCTHEVDPMPAISSDVIRKWQEGHKNFQSFRVGDRVVKKYVPKGRLNVDKLDDRFIGPFKIIKVNKNRVTYLLQDCLLYTSPSPRDKRQSRMPSSA